VSTEVGSLFYTLGLNNKLNKDLNAAETEFKKTGNNMLGVAKTLFTKVGLPIIAVGTAAMVAANEFEKMKNAIIQGTGASGEQLNGFIDSAKFVAKNVPESFETVGKAVADLNTRLGVTGSDLEIFAQEALDFARINKMEVSTAIRQVTRLMADWGVPTADMGKQMDKLTKAAQISGISIENLSESAVRYGVQLRTLGFSQDEAIAILSKWEKEGVATTKVFSGLSIAMANLSEKGVKDIPEAFQAAIKSIKDAKNDAEATSIAMELFGRRAGPDLAIAVKEGRFEIGEYLDMIKDSEGATYDTAKATMSFSDKMKILKNQVTLALEPIGSRLLDAFEKLLPVITILLDLLTRGVEWIASLDTGVKKIADSLQALWAVIGPILLPVLQQLWDAFSTKLLPELKRFWDLVGPILGPVLKYLAIIIGGILIGGLYVLIEVLTRVINVISWLIARVNDVIGAVKSMIGAVVGLFGGMAGSIGGALSGVFNAIKSPYEKAFKWITDKVDAVKKVVAGALNLVTRHSPSVLDQVKTGTGLVMRQYENMFDNLGDMGYDFKPKITNTMMNGVQSGAVSNVNFYGAINNTESRTLDDIGGLISRQLTLTRNGVY
jgi:TP901 family phage tail tape measure protein